MTRLADIQPIKFEDILAGLPPIETLNLIELNRLAQVKVELQRVKENFEIVYYEAQPHQELFHKSQKKIRLILGSNQSGKSICSTVEGIKLSLGIHPYRKMPVPNKGRVIAEDLKHGIGEVIQELYLKYVPKAEIRQIKKYSTGEISKIYYRNNSTVDFLSYEQDTKVFEGWTGHFCQADEPIPRDKYIACIRGLMRHNGILWIAETPLSEPWIYDEIYCMAGPEESRPDVFNFDIMDNKYLTIEEIKDFESRLTDDEKEARLHGRFKHLSGLIYKELKPEIHYIEDFEIPKHWNRYCAMDYHPRTHCAVVWIAIDPRDRAYAYDELWIDKTIKEISEAIKAKEGKDTIRMRFIDPLSATPDRMTKGGCAQREFLRYGLAFRSATKSWAIGKNAVSEYLRLDKEGIPGLRFLRGRTERCRHAFERYQWDEFAGREGEKEQPVKKYGHFPDGTRYILVMRPTYKPPEEARTLNQSETSKGHAHTGYVYGGPRP